MAMGDRTRNGSSPLAHQSRLLSRSTLDCRADRSDTPRPEATTPHLPRFRSFRNLKISSEPIARRNGPPLPLARLAQDRSHIQNALGMGAPNTLFSDRLLRQLWNLEPSLRRSNVQQPMGRSHSPNRPRHNDRARRYRAGTRDRPCRYSKVPPHQSSRSCLAPDNPCILEQPCHAELST